VLHSTRCSSDQSTNQASSRVMMSQWKSISCAVIVATATLLLAPGTARSSDTVGDPGQASRDQLQQRADATSFDGGASTSTGQPRRNPRDGQPLNQQRPDATSSDGSANRARWPSEVAVKRASVFTEFERRVRPSPPPRTAACPHVLTANNMRPRALCSRACCRLVPLPWCRVSSCFTSTTAHCRPSCPKCTTATAVDV
jgi:hypothetical protein